MSGCIGLERGQVIVVPYSIEWRTEFSAEQDQLREVLGDLVLDIEHVGGTAVEHSYAKPVIDVAIAVQNCSRIFEISEKLRLAGYRFESNAGSDGGYIFMKSTEAKLTTHHIHVVEMGDSQWSDYLRFRDTLRRDSSLRNAYTDLKRSLSKRYSADRDSYTASKIDFILAVLANAK